MKHFHESKNHVDTGLTFRIAGTVILGLWQECLNEDVSKDEDNEHKEHEVRRIHVCTPSSRNGTIWANESSVFEESHF